MIIRNIVSVLLFTLTYSLSMTENYSQEPVKVPEMARSITERKLADMMELALSGDDQALKQVKSILALAPAYQGGSGAPYFSSPHTAFKQMLLWDIIGAFAKNQYFLEELEDILKFGLIINYETGNVCDRSYYIKDYMPLFILSDKERQYYSDQLVAEPDSLYINYYLYMDARVRQDPIAKQHLNHMKGKIREDILFKELEIDHETKKISVRECH